MTQIRVGTDIPDFQLDMLSIALLGSAQVHNAYREKYGKELHPDVLDRLTVSIYRDLVPDSDYVRLLDN